MLPSPLSKSAFPKDPDSGPVAVVASTNLVALASKYSAGCLAEIAPPPKIIPLSKLDGA